jgi:hypothetical protein
MKWIKWDDEIPELNVPVLAIIDFLETNRFGCARVGIGWIYELSDFASFRYCCHVPHGDEKCDGRGDYKVLYWMPFPKFPKGLEIDLLPVKKDEK